MNTKRDYNNGCFSPDWLEVDLSDAANRQEELNLSANHKTSEHTLNKEVRLESRQRKDLNTLLKELNEIKTNIEKAAEKQQRLANLMSFYTGEFAQ